jgi:multidrug efflux pump subunit AcrA (membrane-fusion protein)
MNRVKLPLEPVAQFQLPELGQERGGGRYIRRAVSITLLLLASLGALSLLVAFNVRVDDAVRANGVLEPARIWPVRTLEAGMIREVLVQTGDTVARGQPVLRLDPLLLESALAELEAEHRSGSIELEKITSSGPFQRRQQEQRRAQAAARVVTARAELRRKMVENGLGGDVDSLLAAYPVGSHVGLDLSVSEVRSAEAERRLAEDQMEALQLGRFDRASGRVDLEQIEAQIRTLRERLRRLEVSAPAAGTILTEQVERLPGSAVREGELLLEIAESGLWQVVLFVREGEVHKLRLGDSVKAEIQAFRMDERDQLYGSVVHIAADPSGSRGAGADSVSGARGGTYRVVAALDPEQLARIGVHKFRRGYSVEGRIIARSGRVVDLAWAHLLERFDFYWPW